MSLETSPERVSGASVDQLAPRPTGSSGAATTERPSRRVLITMSDTGGGHRAMSKAIAGALERRYGQAAEVLIEDAFGLPPRTLLERVTRLYGPVIRFAPWFYGLLYHALDNRERYDAFARLTTSRTQRKLASRLAALRPDVVVSTHPLINRPLLRAIAETGHEAPVFASVSELVSVHVSWVEPGLALLNTATTESYQAVLKWGAKPGIVRCVGLPVAERFGHVEPTPAELREAMGLQPDRFTALLMGGGEGAGGIEAIVRAIQQTDLAIQLIVVCGHNQRLRDRLVRMSLRTPAFVFGFVDTIPELMHAADVVVTKGGPQSIAEALVAGRPVILTQTLPGQEEGNGSFVESRGVGFRPAPARRLIENLGRLVNDPDLRAWMTMNAVRHGRPAAAEQVAAMVAGLAGLA